MNELKTDVVVLGGGLAGPYAALKLNQAGVRVILGTKGLLGKSGCATKVAYYMHPGKFTPPDSAEAAERGWNEAFGCYVGDQRLLRKINDLNREIVPELERMGMAWRRYPDGKLTIGATGYATRDGQYRLRNLLGSRFGDTGKNIAEMFRNHLLASKVKLLEDVVATSIITNKGRAAGVTLLDYVKGEMMIVKAKVVILATGTGGGYIWTYSTSPREMTGDGLALAYRAGAELTGLEFQLWHIGEAAGPPPWNRSFYIYPFAIPPKMESPRFVDAKGVRFMPDLEETAMWKQCKGMYERMFKKGLATIDGGYFADMRNINKDDFKKYSLQYRLLEKLGTDTTKDLVELHMSCHTMLGGVKIDLNAQTNIPGLYAVGTTSAMFFPTSHGALGTSALAVEHIIKTLPSIEQQEAPTDALSKEEARVMALHTAGDGIRPSQVKRKIRQAMNDYMHYMKNALKMQKALEQLELIRTNELPQMRLGSDTRVFNYDWVEALDAVNMVDVADLATRASIMRTESRGAFQRDDYTDTDNNNWLKNIVVRKVGTKPELVIVPVELPYYGPGEPIGK